MNRQKETEIEQQESTERIKTPGRFVRLLNVLGIFSREGLVAAMPYVFFLMGIAMLYIANSYKAEKTIRDIDKTTKELKTLQSEYISGKSELMYTSKQSEVAKMAQPEGLKESQIAPLKIVVKKQKQENQDQSVWEKLKRIFS